MKGKIIGFSLLNRKPGEEGFLWQYDYGQKMKLAVDGMPEMYEVHFANNQGGRSVGSLGDADGVTIPDEVLLSGAPVFFWLYLHNDSEEGHTEAWNQIEIRRRAKKPTGDPTPQQQTYIEQAIAALTTGVSEAVDAADKAEAAAAHYPKIEGGTWRAWDTDSKQYVDTGIKAQGEDGDPGFSPSASVSKIGKVTTITVTDKTGTTTAEVHDGEDGQGADVIDDTSTAADKAWSASKVSGEITEVKNAINTKVDKTAIDDAGITNRTYTEKFGGEFSVTTTPTTGWGNNPYARASVTGRINKHHMHRVTINGTEYILPTRLWYKQNTNQDIKLYAYLGNIGLFISNPEDVAGGTDNVPFLIISDIDDLNSIDILTETAGAYTILVEQITTTQTMLPKSLLYGDNYTLLERKNNSGTYEGFSMGANALVSPRGTFAFGYGNKITNDFAMAFGILNTITGSSYVIGNNNVVTMPGFVFGNDNEISAAFGKAIGNANEVTASHAIAFGTKLIANQVAMVATGKYNVAGNSDSIFIIGNGSNSARSNALHLDQSGTLRLKGNIYINCNDDSTGGTMLPYESPWELIREDTVTNATETDVEITVDGDGNAYELTDVYMQVWTPQQETAASIGDYGTVRCYYDSSNYITSQMNTWSQAANASARYGQVLLENKNGAVLNIVTQNTTQYSSAGVVTRTNIPNNDALLKIGTFAFDKIVIKKVTGTVKYKLYGKRKMN